MVKKFNEYLNEGLNDEYVNPIDVLGKDFKAEDITKKVSFDVKFFEIKLDKKGIGNMPPYDACIYVMPDDSVEIRTIDPGIVLHGVIVDLDGQTVRDEDLHRDLWHFYSVD